MKFPTQFRALCLAGALLASSTLVHAQYTNGQNASVVLGQPSFTSGTINAGLAGTNQSGFAAPTNIAIDNATGKIFVSDTGNNRILRFSSAASFISGSAAEAVIGQTDFTTGSAANPPSASTLNAPYGIMVDTSGNLWVADNGNSRVLRFANASSLSSGASASQVLGQPNFTSKTGATNDHTMSGPISVALDSSNNLYVMDRGNNRVLRFDNASAAGNGATANSLFGQSNFLSTSFGVSATQFGNGVNNPWAVAVDSNGNLWVADTPNNRLLCFGNAATAQPGASASVVLGQNSFTTSTASTTQTGFSSPIGLAFDIIGRLYVADVSNNRVLVFENPSTLSFAAPASFVLGQTSFTSATSGTTASQLNEPFGVSYFADGYLWIADKSNNRALSYAITPGQALIKTHPVKPFAYAGKTRRFTVNVIDNSTASDAFTLRLGLPKGTTNRSSIRFYVGGSDVTSALRAGTYQTGELAAGASLPISVKVKPRATAHGVLKFTLTATSVTDSSSSVSKTVSISIR
jgi:sugar lactone lactonase YvrE